MGRTSEQCNPVCLSEHLANWFKLNRGCNIERGNTFLLIMLKLASLKWEQSILILCFQ